jgi:hypothetical protein
VTSECGRVVDVVGRRVGYDFQIHLEAGKLERAGLHWLVLERKLESRPLASFKLMPHWQFKLRANAHDKLEDKHSSKTDVLPRILSDCARVIDTSFQRC